MKNEIFLTGIRVHRQKLENELARLSNELDALRQECSHTNATKKFRSNTGNYDPSADSEWYEFDCPDCGKHWSEAK
jgi:uncharacterized protein CbrC (UPF0167 family)